MIQGESDDDGGFRRFLTLIVLAAWAVLAALWNRLQRRRIRHPEVQVERPSPVPAKRVKPPPKPASRKPRDAPKGRAAPPGPRITEIRPGARLLEERVFRRYPRPEVKMIVGAEILGRPKALRPRRDR